ncbi:NBAS subunit of NRZ tethering complex-like isoform X3 [Rhodnius prolixus]
MVYLYNISSQGKYMKVYGTCLSESGFSSATYSEKFNMLFASAKPKSIPVSCKESSVTAGISGWRLINEEPYFKVMFPTQEEIKLNDAVSIFWSFFNYMKSSTCVAKMQISPKSHWLAALHCCGSIRIWHIPGLRLYRYHQSDYMTRRLNIEDSGSTKGMNTPVDIEWQSDEALIVTWDCGKISVHDIEMFEDTYGSCTNELLHGRPRVSTSLTFEGYLALECELVFVSPNGDEMAIDEDEDGKSVLDATSEYIKAVVYFLTDSVEFIPAPKPNQLTRRIYRLLGIKAVTPEERFLRYLDMGHFDKALYLARMHNLDENKVFQRQWSVNIVSSFTIKEFLESVHDEAWVLQECTSRVAETVEGIEELFKFGLERTEFRNIFQNSSENEDVDSIFVESLSELQQLKIKTRLLLLRYRFKFEIYKLIMKEGSNQGLQYDMEWFGKLRTKHIAEIAIIYAREGNPSAVEIILKNCASLVAPYLLIILDNFPETLNPKEYSYILPQCDSENVPIEWTIETERLKDWVENDNFRSLLEEEILSAKYNRPYALTETVISEWYRVRAYQIDHHCGIIRNAVELLRLGKERNVEDLDGLLADFLTAEVIITKLQHDLEMQFFLDISPLDKALKLMEKSTEKSFVEDIQKYFLPFLERHNYNQSEERFELFLNLLVKISSTQLSLPLKFFTFVLNGNLAIVGTVEEFITILHDCVYTYRELNLVEQSLKVVGEVISWLSSLSGTAKQRTLLECVYIIRDELHAAEILQRYDIAKPIIDLHNLKSIEKDVKNIFQEMIKKTFRWKPEVATADIKILLKDILQLQEICFTTFPLAACYELVATAILGAESHKLIEFSSNYICCRKAEEVWKPIDYATSVQLVTAAAINYFNCSSTHQDETMLLAKECLYLIKEEQEEIKRELDLSLAVRLLSEFGVNLLPIQIRNCEDRMKLIECVLEKKKNAYKNVPTLYKLACKLWICDGNSAKRYSIINIRLAEEAFQKRNYELCAELCDNLISHACVDCWQICLKLGSCKEFKKNEFKVRLIEFAYLHCPSSLSCAVNEMRKALERESTFEMLSKMYQDVAIKPETEEGELDLKSKLSFIQRLMKMYLEGTELIQSDVRLKNENLECGIDVIKKHQKKNNCEFLFESAGFLFNMLYSEKPAHDEALCSNLNQVLLEAAKSCIFDDPALGLSILLSMENLELCEKFFKSLSHNPLSYQIAMYFYGLAGYIQENKDFVNVSPNNVCEFTLQHSRSPYGDMLLKYSLQNDNFHQAQTASQLNCGINSKRFIADIDYRRDTIYGLAMSLDLEKVLVAIKLAEQNRMCSKELAAVHLETFLVQHSPPTLDKLQTSLEHPTILSLLKMDPFFVKNRLSAIFDNISGCDFTKIIMYFTMMNAIDSDATNLCGLTPKQHIKLIKKVKATSPAINYIDLINHRHDLLSILQPALTNDNFNNVVRLVKNLPESVRGDFNPNILYRKKAVEEFFYTMREVASLKQCLKLVKGLFNKWLVKVDVSDIHWFIEQTVLSRDSALTLDYEYRKQILLALMTRACGRMDYSKNMRYLTCMIQERLEIMDRVWDDSDLEIPFTKCLKNYLFEIEAAVGDEAKLVAVMKTILLDDSLSKEDVLIAYKASGVTISLNTLISSLPESDNTNVDTILARKSQFSKHDFTVEVDSHNSESQKTELAEQSSNNVESYKKLWPNVFMDDSFDNNQRTLFERLLSETNNIEQIAALHAMLQNQPSLQDCSALHTLQVKLLHKLATVKGNDKFNMIAKLMDEASLNEKEILELINNDTQGNVLTQAWICILGNNPELENLATKLLNDIGVEELKNIVYRIKTVPWDIVKALTCSSGYKKLMEVVLTLDEDGSAAKDVVKILEEIHLTSEASSLKMNVNSTPEALRSFNTTLLFFSYNK